VDGTRSGGRWSRAVFRTSEQIITRFIIMQIRQTTPSAYAEDLNRKSPRVFTFVEKYRNATVAELYDGRGANIITSYI